MASAAFAASALILTTQSASAADAKALFQSACAACHKNDGRGVVGLAPSLAKAEWVAHDPAEARDYLPLVILNGLAGPIVAGGKTFMSAMPPQKQHSDDEIAALATYVFTTLNSAPDGWKDYTSTEISALRARNITHKDLLALRAELVEQ